MVHFKGYLSVVSVLQKLLSFSAILGGGILLFSWGALIWPILLEMVKNRPCKSSR